MPVVLLRFLPATAAPARRPSHCPICGSTVLQGWGQTPRPAGGHEALAAPVSRFHCPNCGHTFRHDPSGLDRAGQTLRARRLGAAGWVLGLSYREVAAILKAHGVEVSHTTIWREGQALLRQFGGQAGPLVRYTIDREFVRQSSPRLGVVVAVDFGDGRPQVLGTINSGAARDVIAWLKTLVRDSGIEAKLLQTNTLDGPPALR